MKVFGNDLADSKAFGNDVVKILAYGETIWENTKDWLCFTALESGTFTLTIPAAVTTSNLSYVEYSLDGRNWVKTNNSSSDVVITTPSVAQGDKVYWRGSGLRMCNSYADNNYSVFSSTANFNVSGNVMSLLTDTFSDSMTWNYNYTLCSLFRSCTTLISAADMLIPLTSTPGFCAVYMFSSCTGLTHAPQWTISGTIGENTLNNAFYGDNNLVDVSGIKITATTLTTKCLYYTFNGCSSLTAPITLTSTAFAANSTECCASMYYRCTSLKAATLYFTTLGTTSFRNMFYGCSSLNYIKCLATDLSATDCLSNWLSGVSSTGTFIQASGVTWPSGASGIPSTWVTIEKRTMPQGYKQVESLSNPNYAYINTNRALNLNNEKLELAFVKQGSGSSMPFGNSNYNYRYGSLKVMDQPTALTIRAGVDYDDQVYKQSKITSVTDDKPHTLQYVGSSSGFQLYLDGALKKTETCAWDAANPFDGNMLFSASTNTSSTAYFHVKPIYYLKIWDGNNTLAVDYVACVRESDNVAGFYDFVNSTFITSSNSNTFTAGAEI